MKQTKRNKYLLFALFCGAIYFPIFHHLGWEPAHNWDESLFAMRAGYMAEEGHYIRDYSLWVEEGPLHRSTKPPFTTWIQALFLKIFGISELALRLPIALMVFATAMLFVWFARRNLGDSRIGYCAGFILATSAGFMREHGARTGDQDAALAFYMFAGAVAFYQYIEAHESRERLKWLALLTFTLIASALTKYVFGLIFLPALFIYAIYKKQLLNILKRGSTWLAALVFMVSVGVVLAMLERSLPGFVEQAFFYEMLDRYATTLEEHYAPWHYYFTKIWVDHFIPGLFLLPVPFLMLFMKQFRPWRDAMVLLFLCALTLLVTISFSGTKLPHYDIPAYPPLALLAGIGLYQLIVLTVHIFKEKKWWPVALVFSLYGLWHFFILPYMTVLERTYMPKVTDPNMKYGYLFRKLESQRPEYKEFTLVNPGFDGQAIYYAGLYNRKKGYKVQLSMHPEWLKEGELVMCCDTLQIKDMLNRYELQGIESYDRCFLAQVKKKLAIDK